MSGTHRTFPKYTIPLKVERTQKKAAIRTNEKSEKAKVRCRDKRCRWPNCVCRSMRLRPEVAHVKAKGIGGDHGARSTADNMLLLCWLMHRGSSSLHSGDKKIVPLTDVGTNGPCEFWERGQLVGRERSAGVIECL